MQYKEKKKLIWLVAILFGAASQLFAQDASLLVLGDLHLDKFEWHDMDYVHTRPQDFAQISKEYPFYTATYMPHLFKLIQKQTKETKPEIKARLQLGDLMEGVAGNKELAEKMGQGCTDILLNIQSDVPWILTKGNHDVSNSPGQSEAWRNTILPFISAQAQTTLANGMYTYKVNDDIQLFILEQFFSNDEGLPETSIIDFLSKELPKSKSKYKILLTHQPVIPVTERCWHLFSGLRRPVKNIELRNTFLELLAEYHVIVFCAHLHQYSKLIRNTPKGPIVQFMFNSVIRDFGIPPQPKVTTSFPSIKDMNQTWQNHTLEKRVQILKEEAKFIRSYYKEESYGYGIVSLKDGILTVGYYRGLTEEPSDYTIINQLY